MRCKAFSLNVESDVVSVLQSASERETKARTSVEEGLFVDHNLGGVGPWSGHSSGDSSGIGLEDDSGISLAVPHRHDHTGHAEEEGKNGSTHPSSIVSSAANRTISNPSSTFLFSIWPRRSSETASWNAVRVWWSMISLDVASGPTRIKVRSIEVFVRMTWGGSGWISPGVSASISGSGTVANQRRVSGGMGEGIGSSV